MKTADDIKILAENRKARHDYFIYDTYEAGIALTGTEVKSLRAGKANLRDSYAQIDKRAEVYLYNLHISPYEEGNRFNHDPLRTRKLLLHRAEINKLVGKVREKGYTLVPLKLYMRRGKVKVAIGLASGKKLYDKRNDQAEKDARREIERSTAFSYKKGGAQ
jgi:SsrA-binding protein